MEVDSNQSKACLDDQRGFVEWTDGMGWERYHRSVGSLTSTKRKTRGPLTCSVKYENYEKRLLIVCYKIRSGALGKGIDLAGDGLKMPFQWQIATLYFFLSS